jgi:hypothetical protein
MLPPFLRRATLPSALLLVSCTATVHGSSHWATRSWTGDTPCDEPHELTIECESAATTVSMESRACGTTGELLVRLVDPSGVERLRQTVRAGDTESTQCWPALRGSWRLAIEPKAFGGSFSITVAANDEPLRIQVRLAEAP